MSVILQTCPGRLDFLDRGERFTSYHYAEEPVGFSTLFAPGRRPITRLENGEERALQIAYKSVNGVAFLPPFSSGRVVSEEVTARRGAMTVGFRQQCVWLAPEDRPLLTEVREARLLSGPGEGRILDLSLRLRALDAPVTWGASETGLLRLRAALFLFPSGGGQLRNSEGDYGIEGVQGRSAAWCACVGVEQGETVGFALLDHPTNPGHPPHWLAQEDGLLSPAPFAYQPMTLAPHRGMRLRYRLLVHHGYVNAGWADARLEEFVRAFAGKPLDS